MAPTSVVSRRDDLASTFLWLQRIGYLLSSLNLSVIMGWENKDLQKAARISRR